VTNINQISGCFNLLLKSFAVKHFVKLASSCEKKTENKNHEFTTVGSQYKILNVLVTQVLHSLNTINTIN